MRFTWVLAMVTLSAGCLSAEPDPANQGDSASASRAAAQTSRDGTSTEGRSLELTSDASSAEVSAGEVGSDQGPSESEMDTPSFDEDAPPFPHDEGGPRGTEDGSPLPSEDIALSTLSLSFPLAARANTPTPLLITGPDDASGPVSVSVGSLISTVHIHRGRGSLTLSLEEDTLIGLGETGEEGAFLAPLDERGTRVLSGTLGGPQLQWSAEEDVLLQGVVLVEAGDHLEIGPGTRVILEEDARLEVEGSVRTQGPALFTKAEAQAWGGLVISSGGTAELIDTWFVGGGGDETKAFGHSNSQPVLKASSASFEMRGGGILDSPGKGMGTYKATAELDDVLISRCDTGGEFVQSRVVASRLHVLETPDADGIMADDDNDALYFVGVLDAQAPLGSQLSDIVLSLGEDDGIDHNDAELTVERAWISDFAHEGIAASGGRTLNVTDAFITKCDQGVEAGYGAPQVVVSHTTIRDNRVGLRFGDDYAWSDNGSLYATHSVSLQNTEANVLNLTDTGAPKPDAITISCSIVNTAGFDGQAGNLVGSLPFLTEACTEAQTCEGKVVGPTSCEP